MPAVEMHFVQESDRYGWLRIICHKNNDGVGMEHPDPKVLRFCPFCGEEFRR